MRRLALLGALLTSACTLGPSHRAPAPPPAAAGPFVEAGTTRVAPEPAEGQWWRLYQDPVLDRLVVDALTHNMDVRVAAANLQLARAQLSEALRLRLPETTTSAGFTRQRAGGNAAPAGSPTGPSNEISSFNLGLDASYQVDLFGGGRRAIESVRDDLGAAQAALDAARIAVAAETARTYAQACGLAAQAAVARETVALQQQTLDLTKRLLQAGRGTQREVDQAGVITENARAAIPQLEAERRAALYALATLTGRPPAEVDAAAASCRVAPNVTSLIPVGDGTALLARRPDIRRAERQLASATAKIGVAMADVYPSIRLLGSLSLGARSLGDLAKSDSFNFSLGPLISWNFPNLGPARARVRQAEAGAEAALATYDGAVLTALKEVEQALARYAGEVERNVALRRAEASASNAARIAILRFEAGRDSFLQRLDAERDRASARASLAQSDAQVAEAQVALFNALGGGWENAPEVERRTVEGSP